MDKNLYYWTFLTICGQKLILWTKLDILDNLWTKIDIMDKIDCYGQKLILWTKLIIMDKIEHYGQN